MENVGRYIFIGIFYGHLVHVMVSGNFEYFSLFWYILVYVLCQEKSGNPAAVRFWAFETTVETGHVDDFGFSSLFHVGNLFHLASVKK
jgi:hypothetical protein